MAGRSIQYEGRSIRKARVPTTYQESKGVSIQKGVVKYGDNQGRSIRISLNLLELELSPREVPI